MRVLRYGECGLLVETSDVLGLAAAARRLDGVLEVVPAARTVLVVAGSAAELRRLRDELAALAELPAPHDQRAEPTAPEVVLDVHYDGADLVGTAAELGLDVDGVVRAHRDAEYVVAFCGFAPGFAYLTGLPPALHVARHAEPRTRVPAGSVGIAGEFSGVYPRASPGGWRLLGRTDARLWDARRDPPALLAPGTRVRFRAS